ncbi:MAG: hypothetical protein MJ208_01130 [Bacilli bacterium]|nr:hypothetical protein [Bacilli bacterium]
MRKILLYGSVALLLLGAFLFLAIGTPLKNFVCMWAGIGIFLVGMVFLIIYIFCRAYYDRKDKEKNDISRGGH